MKKRLNILSVLFLLVLCTVNGSAQEERLFFDWEFKINAGYNIGSTSPLPLPVEIRKIEKFSPHFLAPHVALEGSRWFHEKWGVSAQLTMDYKGFTVHDQVKNLHTEIEMGDDNYTGNFTGKNTTEIRNTYITLPVMATYRISNQWIAQLGPYIAYLYHPDFKGTASDGYIRQGSPTGEKIDVPEASFDFSGKQSRLDYGLLLAGEWEFYTDFALRGQVSWGLKSVFPSHFTGMSFSMYNVYGMIGVSYRIKYL